MRPPSAGVGDRVPPADRAVDRRQLRNDPRLWVERAEVDAGARPGTTTDEQPESLIRLRREVGELRRANEILKTASGVFAAEELDRRLK